jgi:hypothetical protein
MSSVQQNKKKVTLNFEAVVKKYVVHLITNEIILIKQLFDNYLCN